MLLTGCFARSLDEKFRFSLPKAHRDALQQAGSPALFVTPGNDGSLALHTESSLAALGDRLGELSPAGQDVRTFSRLFYSQASRVELDRQGRIRIPVPLAESIGLQREMMLLGVRDHIELWEKSRWEAYLDANQPEYDDIAERAFSHPVPAARKPVPNVIGAEASAPSKPAKPR